MISLLKDKFIYLICLAFTMCGFTESNKEKIFPSIYTLNVLGIFQDPFEFEGTYGEKVDRIRQRVFEETVAKEALARDGSSEEKRLAKEKDQERGPTLGELVSDDLLQALEQTQQELKSPLFRESDIKNFFSFVRKHREEKPFYIFHQLPPGLISLDKHLRDLAARKGNGEFLLPIIGSVGRLEGHDANSLKMHLLKAVFTREILQEASKKKTWTQNALVGGTDSLMDKEDLELFISPAGQAFLYWMYHSLSLHMAAKTSEEIEEINQVKELFRNTLGNPGARAHSFLEKLQKPHASVVFTQESDQLFAKTLVEKGGFLDVAGQTGAKDGTLVFLHKDYWEPNYLVIDIAGRSWKEDLPMLWAQDGRMSIVLAKDKRSGLPFLLAASHGHSTKAEDGRQQIQFIHAEWEKWSEVYPDLQLLIGIDANTKNEQQVKDLQGLLETLGLESTNVGATTIKRRMVTVQHAKAGKVACDQEDFLITLKNGKVHLKNATVGFQQGSINLTSYLPNQENPSDHYAVGSTLVYDEK